jgi:hypothetical protein
MRAQARHVWDGCTSTFVPALGVHAYAAHAHFIHAQVMHAHAVHMMY